MKIKNKDLQRVNRALFSLGNHQGDIKMRWEITKLAKKFNDSIGLLDIEIQKLVNEKGVENKGQKTLSIDDRDYQTLMELDIDVDCNLLSLEYLSQFNPSVQELMDLEVIISE